MQRKELWRGEDKYTLNFNYRVDGVHYGGTCSKIIMIICYSPYIFCNNNDILLLIFVVVVYLI